MADSNDVNKEIQIGSINVLLGNPSECCLDLKYASIVDTNGNYPELLHFKYTSNELDSGNIRPLSTATIVPRNSKLNVSFIHYQPALLEEWYEVKVNISNDEHFSIKNMKIEVDLEEDATNVAIGYVNKDKDQTKVRRDIGKLQTLRANELLQAASVTIPKEGCGIPELQQFQQYLKDYCIVVYQYGTKGHDVIFKGVAKDLKLNLIYHKDHYNVITSLTAAFCCEYYCERC
ncbi:uncharacterized protein LOC108910853 [Anoplophora glabripennis]|uniref:uncharacterized protein LOC108910853 n=1 Tax=Anoplophora glabripennis TaxID=217634 RepID=UPI0008751AB8|nr:uncharacterized protein LOC108910853 [Anoplophora glabripennis]